MMSSLLPIAFKLLIEMGPNPHAPKIPKKLVRATSSFSLLDTIGCFNKVKPAGEGKDVIRCVVSIILFRVSEKALVLIMHFVLLYQLHNS